MTVRWRVVIAEDEPIVRSGLHMLLSGIEDLEVIGEAADGALAVRAAAQLRPDVVLMDVRMPVLDGISATKQIRDLPGTPPRVLILTTFASDENLLGALRAGASGFVLKRAEAVQIAHAVRMVASGGGLVLPEASRHLLAAEATPSPARQRGMQAVARLTARERDVPRLMSAGMSNAEIGAQLFLGTQTIKTHVAAILAKLGARDRTQAVITAYDSGFLDDRRS